MVGQMITFAPYRPSSATNSPACEAARVTTTVLPASGSGIQKVSGPALKQPCCKCSADPFCSIQGARQAVADDFLPLRMRDQALQMKCLAFDSRMGGDRKLTTTAETSQKRAFSAACEFRFAVVQFGRCGSRYFIIRANLDRDCSLANGGQHFSSRNGAADSIS